MLVFNISRETLIFAIFLLSSRVMGFFFLHCSHIAPTTRPHIARKINFYITRARVGLWGGRV